MTRIGAFLVMTAACLLAACDPCASTGGCDRAPTAVIVGRIVEEFLGEGVGGVRIDVVYDSGVAVVDGPTTVRTSADGGFEIRLRAGEIGPVHVTLRIQHDDEPAYVVAVRAVATTAAGEATVLPPWVDSRPRFQFVVQLVRPDAITPVPNTVMEFVRTGGTQFFVDTGEIAFVRGTTAANGWLFLLDNVWTDRVGPVIGDLRIVRASGDTLVLPGIAFTATPQFHEPHQFVIIPVEP